jgi:hypothetical protein
MIGLVPRIMIDPDHVIQPLRDNDFIGSLRPACNDGHEFSGGGFR